MDQAMYYGMNGAETWLLNSLETNCTSTTVKRFFSFLRALELNAEILKGTKAGTKYKVSVEKEDLNVSDIQPEPASKYEVCNVIADSQLPSPFRKHNQKWHWSPHNYFLNSSVDA
jgi:hypothetical protein